MLWRYVSHIPAGILKWCATTASPSPTENVASCCRKSMKPGNDATRETAEAGVCGADESVLGTDPYQCILCKGRLRFTGAMAGEHATKMLSDRLQRMAKTMASDPFSG